MLDLVGIQLVIVVILAQQHLEVDIQDLESIMLLVEVVVVVVVVVLHGVHPQDGVDLVVELDIVITHLELS